MQKFLIVGLTAISLAVGSIGAAAPASAAPINRFCWHHPRAPICRPHHHHHHWEWRHHHRYWW